MKTLKPTIEAQRILNILGKEYLYCEFYFQDGNDEYGPLEVNWYLYLYKQGTEFIECYSRDEYASQFITSKKDYQFEKRLSFSKIKELPLYHLVKDDLKID
jgi:hypothetical protein